MTENELLLAISNMMDHKLKSELQPIKNDLQDLKTEMKTVKEDVQVLKTDVQVLKTEMQAVKEDVQVLKTEMQAVKEDVQGLKTEVQAVKEDVQGLKTEMHHMKLYQENVIMPRLNTIESCYTDTYGRYRKYADKMETAFEDIGLLKKVVSDHSSRLQAMGC